MLREKENKRKNINADDDWEMKLNDVQRRPPVRHETLNSATRPAAAYESKCIFAATTAPFRSLFLLFVCLVLLLLPRVVMPCDVMGATYCIHKPAKDLKEENFEEYCDKYKEHLECVFSKYKGCDKKEKYVEAMESMIKGLRKKAKQVRLDILFGVQNELIPVY